MNNEEIQKILLDRILVFDGGFGTELYRKGFFLNTSYDALALSNPNIIRSIHEAYLEAGSDVLTTNTYNANSIKLAEFGMSDKVDEINAAAVAIARRAAAGKENVIIAGSVGPIADNSDRAQEAMIEQAMALEKGGADLIIFESINSLSDLARVINCACKLNLAWFPSFVLDGEARLSDGTQFAQVLPMLANNLPAAIGLNCGLGPDVTLLAFEKIHKLTELPFVVQPGAGSPRVVDNRFLPMTTPEYFTTYALRYTSLGARAVGGCCGIGPEHIADLVRSLKPLAKTEHAAVFQVKEKELPAPLEPTPLPEISSFAKKLSEGKWIKLIEMLPPKGYDLSGTIEKARQLKEAGFDAINLPDGPRAGCRLSQIITAIEIQEKVGIETIVHCCSRDRNLISLQSMLLGCMAKNLNNILFITGDPPKLGDYPFSSGVFDVDSIGMLKILKNLNQGIDVGGFSLGNGCKTSICAGSGADPNAIDKEREYRRVAEKIESGAKFIITQPVFDPETLLAFLKRVKPLGCPVIAGVWPFASYRNALFMKTEVPGVVVPDWIMDAMKNAGDKEAQRATGISIARKIIEAIKDDVQGIATSAPLGNISTVIEVCKPL